MLRNSNLLIYLLKEINYESFDKLVVDYFLSYEVALLSDVFFIFCWIFVYKLLLKNDVVAIILARLLLKIEGRFYLFLVFFI